MKRIISGRGIPDLEACEAAATAGTVALQKTNGADQMLQRDLDFGYDESRLQTAVW